MKTRDRLIKLIEAARPDLKDRITEEMSEEQLDDLFTEAMKPVAVKAEPGDGNDGDAVATGITQAELDEQLRMVEARSSMREAIDASPLPDLAKQKLRADFDGRASFKEAEVTAAIEGERTYLSSFVESGNVSGLGQTAYIEGGESQFEKTEQMLDAFFDPENRDQISFKEAYVQVTGDSLITGQMKYCNRARMREALGPSIMREALDSTSWSSVLGDSIHRRMIKDYVLLDEFDAWRHAVDIVPVSDFRTNHRTRWGGYPNLPIVAQSDPYLALSSPTDEEATYAVAKRGGTESITLEMIKNDDVGEIRRIPGKLSTAAKRTVSEFVLDFFVDNGVLYDGVAFFHATHGNLGSAVFSKTSYAAARLAMQKQTEKDSGKRMGISPDRVFVPFDLEETAADVFRRNTEQDKTFIQSLSPLIIPVWYWDDATDWVALADPAKAATIEIGFLDGNEEPELFVQDSPTVGSMFNNDTITYKIRHPYGGVEVDYRGAYKAVVAG